MIRAARSVASLAASLIALFALGGCSGMFGSQDSKNPGEPLGTFALAAAVDDNSTCAELAASAPRPWDFSVTLRHDATKVYWITASGPITGSLDAKGTFAFSTTQNIAVHGVDKAKGLGACTMIRTDSFSGSFVGDPNADGGAATLTGSLRYGYVVAPGSDCRDLIDGGLTSADPLAAYDPNPQPVAHGAFSSLPCFVRFDVTGTRAATP
jgi:hypothetical protein